MAHRQNSSGWRFDDIMQAGPSIRDTKLVLQEVPSTVTTRQTISVMPINTTPLPRVERYTLQEVQQSPTYYTSASVSKHNSVDSNFSSGSTSSSRAMSPPGSPQKRPATSDHAHRSELQHEVEENEQIELKEEETPKYPSWTASYHHTTPKEPHPPLMVGSDMPLGWLRPSLNPTAVLDPVLRPEAPLHFVFAGFGNTQVWHSLFGVQVTMPMTGAMAERTVHWPVDSHQAICTLVTPDMDHPKTLDEWKNLVLCRLGITTIMLCLDIHTSVHAILEEIRRIDDLVSAIDAQHTWYERLTLLFYHDASDNTRPRFVLDALPTLVDALPVMPCIMLFSKDQAASIACRRIVFEQSCLHQFDHGWWHGSIPADENASDSEDESLTSPVVTIIKTSSNRTESYVYGKTQPNSSSSRSQSRSSSLDQLHISTSPTDLGPNKTAGTFYYDSPPSATSVQLQHRFSKKWAEGIRRSHTILQDDPAFARRR